jgi:predicted nucleic acid-binding protein
VDVEAAADALVHGASVATADAGFARFTGVRRINPLVE